MTTDLRPGVAAHATRSGSSDRPDIGGDRLITARSATLHGLFCRAAKDTKILLTDRRVILSYGILRKRSLELLLAKVESIGVNNTVLGVVFGYTTLVIGGTGGSKQILTGVRSANAFRQAVQVEIERVQQHFVGTSHARTR
jgi:hypothetical protein